MSAPGRRRTLALISLASLGWAFSFGLGAPLSALWLKDAGLSEWAIGLNTSAYYLGVAAASPFVPWLMRRANRACVVIGMLLDAGTTALFPWCDGAAAWHLLRLAGGVGTALSLVPMETQVNHNAAPEHRARDFGVYAFCVVLGMALGGVVGLPIYPHAPRLAFAVGGLVTLAAVAAVWLEVPARCETAGAEEGQAAAPWRDEALPLGTAWAQGFLEGGTLTFLVLFLRSRGHGEAEAGAFLGALFAGVLLAQLPLAWLADRVGRLRVLLTCHGLLLAGLLAVPATRPPLLLGAELFALGACCGAMYPLGLALLGERVAPAGLARANALYLASNCAGSLSGPLVMGVVIEQFGLSAQFATGAAALAVVVVSCGLMGRRKADALGDARRAA